MTPTPQRVSVSGAPAAHQRALGCDIVRLLVDAQGEVLSKRQELLLERQSPSRAPRRGRGPAGAGRCSDGVDERVVRDTAEAPAVGGQRPSRERPQGGAPVALELLREALVPRAVDPLVGHDLPLGQVRLKCANESKRRPRSRCASGISLRTRLALWCERGTAGTHAAGRPSPGRTRGRRSGTLRSAPRGRAC
jgi:hypothetical protein